MSKKKRKNYFINGFSKDLEVTRLKQNDVVQAVVFSYLTRVRVKPNQWSFQ